MRGYDRVAVDAWQEEVAELVARLEEQPPRDVAVRHALDEVGRETSAILHSAHESAGEIEARSRSQADARLEQADREAEAAVREAEERADRVEGDVRTISDQRARLIEEMRQLADEVLAVADDALERLEPPSERRPEPVANADAQGLIDTVEDEPTLEAEDDDTPGFGAGEETRMMQVPGETQPFDVAYTDDNPADEDPTAGDPTSEDSSESSAEDPQSPERP